MKDFQEQYDNYRMQQEAKEQLAETLQSIDDEDREHDRKPYLKARDWQYSDYVPLSERD